MRKALTRAVTIAGRRCNLIDVFVKRYDLSMLHDRLTVDTSVGVRILGLGFNIQAYQSTRTWTLALGHSWLLDVQIGGTAEAVSSPLNTGAPDFNPPGFRFCMTILGSITKSRWTWEGFEVTNVLFPGHGRVMRWSHQFG
ncbi:hypothetical protein HOU03_gp372 [Caulobacter phage CcrSC]|uniref:Uncharacterized protein n=1 Tax=Caulobacter phage CcrSC TaxID=2283272 RepID=A0A385EDZ6_9CAUD|nr:hypothetical protein HOU03_gp372 [Caulobacter phage CcrSC]AXQ69896.1 hypothetical protein CcrSC_gp314 [Caulobacter phage CcrSC]